MQYKSPSSKNLVFNMLNDYYSKSFSIRTTNILNSDNKLKRVLFYITGGPGFGKTTFIYNFCQILKKNNEDINNFLKIGSRLCSVLNSEQPDIKTVIENGYPILVDNHGSKKEIIETIIEISKKFNYKIILVIPYVDKEIFMKRLEIRKHEISREYSIERSIKDFIMFNENLLSKIIKDNGEYHNLFDKIIIFDNRFDNKKVLIYVKNLVKSYVLNKKIYNIIKKQKLDHNISYLESSESTNKYNKFVEKSQLMTWELEYILNILINDLQNDTNQFDDYLCKINKIKLKCHNSEHINKKN